MERKWKKNFFSDFLKLFALTNAVGFALSSNNQPRQFEKIGGDEVFRREISDASDIYQSSGEKPKPPRPFSSGTINSLVRGRNLLNMPQPEEEPMRSVLHNFMSNEYPGNAENYRTDVLDMLNKLSNGELSRSLANDEVADYLLSLKDASREESNYRNKRGMDSLLGETFGVMKRYLKNGSTLAKRNFDEIDNVGFNNWSKRPYSPDKDKKAKPRMDTLALAKRDFGNSRWYPVSSLAKRSVD